MLKNWNDLKDTERYAINEYESWLKSAKESANYGDDLLGYKLDMTEIYLKQINEHGLIDYI